jgi:hypothetical protein
LGNWAVTTVEVKLSTTSEEPPSVTIGLLDPNPEPSIVICPGSGDKVGVALTICGVEPAAKA